ncbi:UDP-N-acetylmuramoyl-L-alanine--D-glutamate ligase [Aquibacillus rhizosphaerae]|uniref:UDP-N-acetylmuramoylalanine--D-glutamate ligase n=1 Tax=Aquibacillus rhizosphaerae TaxID=3051431 RepID=A0ABT7L7S2_9BACI|nr:UDP-N-acetylmuramoyl-L-alanine--D-glutamate ligase [Aquibacillus sp. LR5S19]MDL4841265.1 UDP-N-acetylmuramoyl-L-alanine--D-glutamate ligase [Aquibacillus sp. LR5S19]
MNQLTNFPYQHVLVLGLAKSGTAAAKLLVRSGKRVRVNDLKATSEDSIVKDLQTKDIEVIVGEHPLTVLDGIDILVKNPGIPYYNIVVQEAQKRGIPIITEVELAGQLVSSSLIGITGSNGKTTTTTLIFEMLKHSDQQVKIAGNIGEVATEVAESLQKEETMVIELSSFQLLGVQKFKPKVSVILNLFEAHLDYHETFENYKNAKANIFMNQTESEYLIYNADDPKVVEMIQFARATKVPFSTELKQEAGAWCDQEFVYFKNEKIIALNEIALVGKHNIENVMAAISAALLKGATKKGISQVLTTFTGVKHRLQFVENINGRLFYNDSKATNILATSKALKSFDQSTILLAGGLDRGNDFDELLPYLKNVKAMVVFGETALKLRDIAYKSGIEKVELVDNVKHAAQKAYQLSNKNDVILLSPACASWDQYRTFEERGDMFINAVHTLK